MEQTNLENQHYVKGKKFPQYFAVFSVSLSTFATGCVAGWTANISEDMKKYTYNQIEVDDYSLGWIGSIAILGAALFCVPAGFICDYVGRKISILCFTIPFMVGWLFIIFAKWLWMLYLGRFLTGIGFGGVFVVAPAYVSESVEKDIRGELSSYFDLFVTSGSLFAYIMGMVLDMNLYTIIMGITPLVFAFMFVFQPETPIYLASKNKDDKAKRSLMRLRGTHYDVQAELDSIKHDLLRNDQKKANIAKSFKSRAAKKSTFICCTLMFLQQIGGINAIVIYTSTIFVSTGVDLDPKLSTIIFGAIKVVATLISTKIVDKLGRRFLLLCSNIGTGISLTAFAIFFTLRDRNIVDANDMPKLGFLPLVSLSLYVILFAFGMGPVPWVLVGELYPPEVKAVGTAFTGIVGCLAAFLVTKFYFNLESSIGPDLTFYLFAGIAFLSVIFVYLFVPETKNKSLAEIQKELNK